VNKIFYKVVYHHIIYIYDFLVNLDNFFAMVYMGFHESCSFHLICSRYTIYLAQDSGTTYFSFKKFGLSPSTMKNVQI
jgi:hypothetical protein